MVEKRRRSKGFAVLMICLVALLLLGVLMIVVGAQQHAAPLIRPLPWQSPLAGVRLYG